MPVTINGSPTHALIVHGVVVLLPLSVIAALVLVFIPASRRAFGVVSVVIAFVACLFVPLAFASGGDLRQRVPHSSLIDKHVNLAHELLPAAIVFGLALAAFVAIDVWRRLESGDLNRVEARVLSGRSTSGRPPRGLFPALGTLLVIASLVTAITVVRVGDSGAKAAWHDRLTAAHGPGH